MVFGKAKERSTHEFELGVGEQWASLLFVEKKGGKEKNKSVGFIYLFTY